MNKNLKNLLRNLKFPSEARKFEILGKIFEIFVQALPSTPFSIVYSRSPLPPMAPVQPSLSSLAGPQGFPTDSVGGFHSKKPHGPHEGFSKPIPEKNMGPMRVFKENPLRMLRSGPPGDYIDSG